MLNDIEVQREEYVIVHANKFKNRRKGERVNDINKIFKKHRLANDINVVHILTLKEMKYKEGKAVAVTAIKNFLDDIEYKTTKDVEAELNRLIVKFPKKDDLRDFLAPAIEMLSNMTIKEGSRPPNYFPILLTCLIMPKNGNIDTDDLCLRIEDMVADPRKFRVVDRNDNIFKIKGELEL